MVHRPEKRTLAIGLAAVAVLFVPIPVVTQLIGIPLLLYAAYRHWGREVRPEPTEGSRLPSFD